LIPLCGVLSWCFRCGDKRWSNSASNILFTITLQATGLETTQTARLQLTLVHSHIHNPALERRTVGWEEENSDIRWQFRKLETSRSTIQYHVTATTVLSLGRKESVSLPFLAMLSWSNKHRDIT
jgi:hypothetical protein